MKVLTVLGARPQFIKASAVSRVVSKTPGVSEVIVHTGQHFDINMSQVFFSQMHIPQPKYNLGISNLSHGAMTGRMLEGIEPILKVESPDWVLIYGDTNSTLAAALAAVKLAIPIAHVEAGLRSFNPEMPEEINRIIADRVSNLLLCPTETALQNLSREGYPFAMTGRANTRIKNPINDLKATSAQPQVIEMVGDVMLDNVEFFRPIALKGNCLNDYGLTRGEYALCTLHRQENTNNHGGLASILSALSEIAKSMEVVIPLHPRTAAILAKEFPEERLSGLMVIDPLPYLEMLQLQACARLILTDSGGMQKEAFFNRVPCITLRNETEWVETVQAGWNTVVGADASNILEAFNSFCVPTETPTDLFGRGNAAELIIEKINSY